MTESPTALMRQTDPKYGTTQSRPQPEVARGAGGPAIGSSMAVADGYVYFGCYDHKVYCLNASTGDKIWNYTTGNTVESCPSVANGYVYVGSWDGNIYCLDAINWGKNMELHCWRYGGVFSRSCQCSRLHWFY